jgi:exosome complex exonuclease DIS3/RRP44
MPPPSTNFDTLKDILRKRRGLDLDVSTSGALADSLDRCIVRVSYTIGIFITNILLRIRLNHHLIL